MRESELQRELRRAQELITQLKTVQFPEDPRGIITATLADRLSFVSEVEQTL